MSDKTTCSRCGADTTNMETDHRLFRCTGGSGSVTTPNERQRCHKCNGYFGLADGGFLEDLDEHGDRVFVCESCEPNMASREQPAGVVSLLAEIQGPIRAEYLPRTLDRLEIAIERLLDAMPEFEGGDLLVGQLGEEMAGLRNAARKACRQAGITWTSKFEQERWMRKMTKPAIDAIEVKPVRR